jgi:hypothetical protein
VLLVVAASTHLAISHSQGLIENRLSTGGF